MIDVDAVVQKVRALGQGLVAIDGLPVSGKSTLAQRLEDEFGASVIHLDDFVRPEGEWRDRAVPAFPFPYFRYNDFMGAVADLSEGRIARYRLFDWATGRLSEDWRIVRPDGLCVVEGVSALHPDLAPRYHLRLWIESDASSTLAAALARGGGDWEDAWQNLFMPSVALYMASDPRQRADYCVAGRGAGPVQPFL